MEETKATIVEEEEEEGERNKFHGPDRINWRSFLHLLIESRSQFNVLRKVQSNTACIGISHLSVHLSDSALLSLVRQILSIVRCIIGGSTK